LSCTDHGYDLLKPGAKSEVRPKAAIHQKARLLTPRELSAHAQLRTVRDWLRCLEIYGVERIGIPPSSRLSVFVAKEGIAQSAP
jgi:hypothetical protein